MDSAVAAERNSQSGGNSTLKDADSVAAIKNQKQEAAARTLDPRSVEERQRAGKVSVQTGQFSITVDNTANTRLFRDSIRL